MAYQWWHELHFLLQWRGNGRENGVRVGGGGVAGWSLRIWLHSGERANVSSDDLLRIWWGQLNPLRIHLQPTETTTSWLAGPLVGPSMTGATRPDRDPDPYPYPFARTWSAGATERPSQSRAEPSLIINLNRTVYMIKTLRHAAEHCGACPLAVPVIVSVAVVVSVVVVASKRVVRCSSGAQFGPNRTNCMWGTLKIR